MKGARVLWLKAVCSVESAVLVWCGGEVVGC